MTQILVASEDQEALETLKRTFNDRYSLTSVNQRDAFVSLLKNPIDEANSFELLFVDIDFVVCCEEYRPNGGLRRPLKSLTDRYPGVEIVVLCSQHKSKEAIGAVKAGAHDYLISPLNASKVDLLRERIEKRLRQKLELDYLREGFWKKESAGVVRTGSRLMKKVFEQVRSVAPTLSTVLLWGETGTGKGVMARLVHAHSSRSDGPFISVHCGAMPDTLIESELFGHERGAFTGADRRKLGKFEIAKGGTVFLDEIATITQAAQIKLLQVLQERTFQRIGGEANISADVRIIAATNDDLLELNRQGRFRKDLYFRLNVFPIELPALRDRIEDLGSLAQEFLARLNRSHGKNISSVDSRVMDAFKKYSWPGNIRELENLIERAYILENSDTLTPESFPTELLAFPAAVAPETSHNVPTLSEARQRSIELAERQYLREVLNLQRGRIDASARTAGISTRQLHKLMKKYCLRKEDFK
jgi:DNA-binding NtrC family response regulator